MVKASQGVGRNLLAHPPQAHLVDHSGPLRPIFAIFTENHLCMGPFPQLGGLRCSGGILRTNTSSSAFVALRLGCAVLQVDGVALAGGGGPGGGQNGRLSSWLRVGGGVGSASWAAAAAGDGVGGGRDTDGGAEPVLQEWLAGARAATLLSAFEVEAMG